MNQDEISTILLKTDDLLSYLYAWKDIGNIERVKTWAEKVIQTDEGLLELLLRLRGHVISSDKGLYLSLELTKLSEFIGEEEVIKQRLDRIESEGQNSDFIKKIRAAQEHARF